MRWKEAEKIPDGTVRRRKLFAIVPTLCTDGYWYWLEWVLVAQEYDRTWDKWFTHDFISLRS